MAERRIAIRRRLAALGPSRWPVRWRLAAVSASLTFVILLTFAAVVGRLTQQRLENDFTSELESTANEIAFNVRIDPFGNIDTSDLEAMVPGADATVRVVTPDGRGASILNERPLPPPQTDLDTIRFDGLEVATARVLTNTFSPIFVQYARDHSELDATVDRLWLFLVIGVAGGTILATLAGLAVAGRAMRPIAALTATARDIASTRDPSQAMPEPAADDEVAELARTLDDMLRELDAARNEAQGMVQAQREFVADASHELRTPLTSILANLELLQHSLAGADSEESEMVDSALRSSRRMRRLVGDLLILARADAGRQGARRHLDLASVTEAAAAEVRPLAGDHEIACDTRAAAVLGNADELHRLVVNLIDNGVRHTPPGTTIRITTRAEKDDSILEVADDGPGLPAGMQEHIFSRFVRGDGPADVAADAGTGLGLAIVRAVAESHDGSVTAGRSSEGGALFRVSLPASSERSDAREPEAFVKSLDSL